MGIGQNIRVFRKKRGMTQNQLGEKIGMTGGAVRSYENGTTVPKRRVVEKIARALDVPAVKIMSGDYAAVPINSGGGDSQESRTSDILLYNGVLAVLKELYDIVEGRMVVGENGECRKYYIIHSPAGSFVLHEKDIAAIACSAKASLQPMAEYMKRIRGGSMAGAGSGV